MNSPAERYREIQRADKKQEEENVRNDKARSRTRVNIGSAFQRWRELKQQKACNQTPRLLWFFSIGENTVSTPDALQQLKSAYTGSVYFRRECSCLKLKSAVYL